MANLVEITAYLNPKEAEKFEEAAEERMYNVTQYATLVLKREVLNKVEFLNETLGISRKTTGHATNKAYIKNAIELNRRMAAAWEEVLANMEGDKIKTNYKIDWNTGIWETDLQEIKKAAKRFGVSTQEYLEHLKDQLDDLSVSVKIEKDEA